MVNRTGKIAQPVWVKKGQAAKVGPTPKAPNNLSKMGNAYAKINSDPTLVDKVGNGRIEHDDNGMPARVASKSAEPKNLPKVGNTTLSKGMSSKASFHKSNSPRGR